MTSAHVEDRTASPALPTEPLTDNGNSHRARAKPCIRGKSNSSEWPTGRCDCVSQAFPPHDDRHGETAQPVAPRAARRAHSERLPHASTQGGVDGLLCCASFSCYDLGAVRSWFSRDRRMGDRRRGGPEDARANGAAVGRPRPAQRIARAERPTRTRRRATSNPLALQPRPHPPGRWGVFGPAAPDPFVVVGDAAWAGGSAHVPASRGAAGAGASASYRIRLGQRGAWSALWLRASSSHR
jgi:hypothetical protein